MKLLSVIAIMNANKASHSSLHPFHTQNTLCLHASTKCYDTITLYEQHIYKVKGHFAIKRIYETISSPFSKRFILAALRIECVKFIATIFMSIYEINRTRQNRISQILFVFFFVYSHTFRTFDINIL